MRLKEAYQNILIELRKHKSPSLHLEEYNYYIKKGIQEYANERYALYESTQQLSDDLQPLAVSATATITTIAGITTVTYTGGFTESLVPVVIGKRYGSDLYKFKSPNNYWHMLGSHVTTSTLRNYRCFPAGHEDSVPSKRLSADIGVGIMNNSYLKPSNERVYHTFTDGFGDNTKPSLSYLIGDIRTSIIKTIDIDYLKEPTTDSLTVTQRDTPGDSSSIIEFPEYACNEIIKRVVKLILEASSDPRMQSHIPINKSI